jgi:FAD/FMN-containing dehydrogenase
MQTAARQSASTLSAQSGVSDAARYPNYAIYDTPLESIYGDNLPRLRSLKAQVDPNNVMGLAGGFKF